MSETTQSITSIFKLLFTVFILMIIMAGMFSYYNYLRHIPKDIDKYTYTDNTLFFTLAPANIFFITLSKSSGEYELTLPKGTIFNQDDKLSIVFLSGVKPPPKDLKTDVMYMKYGVKPIELNPTKEIIFFVNDTLKYDLKDNLVLKSISKDPTTGEITATVFE